MTRYFMTIHEAAQLIVQAGGVGRGGDVFVLDMGEPVRIIDLAHDMIRLSGLEPERDIPVVITGIRPGEKLHEGLFEDSRGGRAHAPREAACARAARRSRRSGSRSSSTPSSAWRTRATRPARSSACAP